jgi:acyl-CoA reductase-like NAD-dependent aldehyde dehydrogenase
MTTVPFSDIKSLYINGNWQASSSNEFEDVVNPATEQVIGQAPVASVADAEAAIAAAREAFDNGPWPTMTFAERIEAIKRFRDCLQSHEADVCALLQAEVGASYMLLKGPQFGGVIEALDYCMELAAQVKPETNDVVVTPNIIDPTVAGTLGGAVTFHEPYGVVAGISAYNYPLLINMTKLAPALITGNCLVLKPSPLTPFSALLLGKIAEESGLPAGVLNIVTGGVEVGSALTSDPRVDLISFTGSDTVGATILAQSAKNLKKVHLELGGKSAMIVREDADLAIAAGNAAFNFTLHAGQGCALLTRYLVHNSIRPAFTEAVKAVLGQLKVGDPADPQNLIGPLISKAALAKTEHYVKKGLEEGARLVFGGQRPEGLEKGYFHNPTLFDDVDNASTVAQEEVFGPIGVIIGFDTDEEAIAIANNSNFGLSGGIISEDKATAFAMAQKIRTGDVKINGGTGGLYFRAPFGGYKRSGVGREFGPNWLKEYMLEKSIHYPIG